MDLYKYIYRRKIYVEDVDHCRRKIYERKKIDLDQFHLTLCV